VSLFLAALAFWIGYMRGKIKGMNDTLDGILIRLRDEGEDYE
jgi:hypothetical protein